ncbi:MAG: hypothetical protein Fur003_6310 [Candidatus Dojkabacteria bacterium]
MRPRNTLFNYLLPISLLLTACGTSTPQRPPLPQGEGSVPYSTENAPNEVQELYRFAEEWVTNQREGLVAQPLSDPQFHYVIIPATGEVADTDIDFEFMAKLLDFFFTNSDRGKLLIAGNVFENVSPPAQHLIIFLNRTEDIPSLVLKNGEATVVSELEDGSHTLTTFIALNGPKREYNAQTYWSIAQAMCLGFTQNTPNNDAYCNVFAANATAGYIGLDKETAKEWIASYGTTELPTYIAGAKSAEYVFDEIVYDSFSTTLNNK